MDSKQFDFAELSNEDLKQLSNLESQLSREKNEDVILIAYRDRNKDEH